MDLTTGTPKDQVVIPKRVRNQFGLVPGQQLQVLALPGRIELALASPWLLCGDFYREKTPSSASPTVCDSAESGGGLVRMD